MSNTRIPSPARSQGSLLTPRRYKSRSTRSVGSPARLNTSGRLSAIIMQDSFCSLSPLPVRRSVLNDDTQIEEPRRKSWWKKLKENSRDVIEVLETSKVRGTYETVEEILNVEVLSQEKKNYTLDLPDSSDSESINSIVMPQRRLFIQKENVPLGQMNPDTSKTKEQNKSVSATTKKLIQNNNKQRPKPVFASALLNISPDKTVGDKTKDIIVDPPVKQVRNIFGNRPAAKRKNMFAEFIVSESEDEVSEIQPKIFGFQKQSDQQPGNTATRPHRESSPALSITTAMDMDDWKYLPSSTMVENQLEFAATPGKKARLSKLSEGLESEPGTVSNVSNKTKNTSTKNKSLSNQSKTENIKERSKITNMSMTTRNRAKFSNFLIEENKSLSPNKSDTNNEVAQKDSSRITQNKSNKTNFKDVSAKNLPKVVADVNISSQPQMAMEQSDDENNFSLEYDKSDSDSNNVSNESQIKVNNTLTSKTVQQNEISLKQNNKQTSKLNSSSLTQKPDKIREEALKSDSQKDISQSKASANKSIPIVPNEEPQQHLDQNLISNNPHETILKTNNHLKNVSTQQIHTENHEISEKSIAQNISLYNKTESKNDSAQNDTVIKSTPNDKSHNTNKITAHNEENNQENDAIETEQQEVQDQNDIIDQNDPDELDLVENQSENEVDELDHAEDQSENETDEQDNEEMECDVSDAEQAMEDSEQCDENNEESNNTNNSEQVIEESDNEKSHNATEKQDDNNSKQKIDDHISEDSNNLEEQEITDEQANLETAIEDEDDAECHEITEVQDSDQEVENDDNIESEAEVENEQSDKSDDENEQADISEEENEQSDKSDDEINQESREQESENSAQVEIPASDSEIETGNIEEVDTPQELELPEAILRNKNHSDSLTPPRHDNSLRKTKSIMLKSIRPSLLPPRESTGMTDGPSNSSAEGSGWDSHRTTRKTLRQTFGKDFTPRKSLRALVMEKSAKRQTELNNAYEISKVPQANSTELPEYNDMEETVEPSINETHTRQATLEECLQKIKQMHMKRNMRIDQEVRNFLTSSRQCKQNDNIFKVPAVPIASRRPAKVQSKSKTKTLKSSIQLSDLPIEFLEDMKYRPPKRYQPKNASWSTKRLYKFLEDKLEPKYDYKARVRAEKLIDTIYHFTKDLKKHDVAPIDAVDVLKHEMARLNIVKTHFEFYEFFNDFMPREIRVKVIPDIVNKIPTPRGGIFSNIMTGHSTQG